MLVPEVIEPLRQECEMKSANTVRRIWMMLAAVMSSAFGCSSTDELDLPDSPTSEQVAALSEQAEDTDVLDVCTKWCKDCPTCNIYCCELTLEDLAATPAREEVGKPQSPAEDLAATLAREEAEKPQSLVTQVSARGSAQAPATGELTSEEPTEEACTKMCKTCEKCEPFCCQATSFEDLL